MNDQIVSVSELAARLRSDPQLQAQVRADPAGTIAGLAAPLRTDVWIYRVVVVALGLAILTALGGAIFLSAIGKTDSTLLTAIGSAAVGALAGLLAPTPGMT